MQAIQNFAFEEHLVRVIERGGEPWFVGKDVCGALAIKNHNDALGSLDEDEKGVAIADPLAGSTRGGGSQEVVIVSEPGVYRLVFRSRKEEAERFKRWLAHEVLPQIRRTGEYAPDRGESPGAREAYTIAVERDAPLAARVEAIRLAKSLFGRDRARMLWEALGLPAVPEPSPFESSGEAVRVMQMILDHPLGGGTVRERIADAVDGNLEAAALLLSFGIRVTDEPPGFYLSNTAEALWRIFRDTSWPRGEWRIVLLRLAGALKHGKVRFADGHQARASWFPITVLDDWCGTRH